MARRPNQKKASRQTHVAEALREAILSGKMRPGDPIAEVHLAREHDVSQTTVREALVKLEHAGLVRRVPNVGTFVTQLSAREIREHLRLRVMLEGLAGLEAARLMTAADFEEMAARLEAVAGAVARNEYYEAAQADLQFHRYFWMQSGDQTLYRVLEQLTVPLFAFAAMERRRIRENLADVVQAHEPILQAMKAGDPAAIQQSIRSHIETSYAEFLGGIAEERYVISIA